MDASVRLDRVEVLLVESDPDEARLIQEELRGGKVDAGIRIAADGAEALALLRGPPDEDGPPLPLPLLVLLDPSPPGTDGRLLLREMQTDPELRRIPVVLLADAPADQDDSGEGESCVRCCATRPVDLVQVFHIVRSVEDLGLCIVTRGAEV